MFCNFTRKGEGTFFTNFHSDQLSFMLRSCFCFDMYKRRRCRASLVVPQAASFARSRLWLFFRVQIYCDVFACLQDVLLEIWISSVTEKIQRKFIRPTEYYSLCYFLTKGQYKYGTIVRFQSLTVHVTDRRNNGGFPVSRLMWQGIPQLRDHFKCSAAFL